MSADDLLDAALEDRLVRRALECSGWRLDFRANVEELLGPIRREGYSEVLLASRILERLGGLKVSPRGGLLRKFSPPEFEFDPRGVASGELARIAELETHLGVALCPIGEWGGEFVLLVDENGRILAEAPYALFILGGNISGALKLMVRGTPAPTKLPY